MLGAWLARFEEEKQKSEQAKREKDMKEIKSAMTRSVQGEPLEKMLVSLQAEMEGADKLTITGVSMGGSEVAQVTVDSSETNISHLCSRIKYCAKESRNVDAQLVLPDGTYLDSCQVIKFSCNDFSAADIFGLGPASLVTGN
jgi:hypothetical protein